MLILFLISIAIAQPPKTIKNWISKQPKSTLDILIQTDVIPQQQAKQLQQWSHQKMTEELIAQLNSLPTTCTPWYRFKTPLVNSNHPQFAHDLFHIS